jgi:hypothetical protein
MYNVSLLEGVVLAATETFLIGLAVVALLRAWFMGSIFSHWRSYMEVRKGLLGELLGCPLCLSYHVAFWLELLCVVPLKLMYGPWSCVLLTPIVVMAAAGLGQSIWFHYHRDW